MFRACGLRVRGLKALGCRIEDEVRLGLKMK